MRRLLIFWLVLRAGSLPAAAQGPVARVAMLPLADRTTIVIELSESPERVAEVSGDAASFVVDAGPFTSPARAQELTPSVASAFVSTISIAASRHQDGANYLRIRIATRGTPARQLRWSGRRVYLDFSAAAAAPETAPSKAPDAQTPEIKTPAPVVDPEVAYRALERTVSPRARQLAARPDVKGLLRLREEIERRDKELGGRQPATVNQLLQELSRLTDEARARQLERDRAAFLRDEKK